MQRPVTFAFLLVLASWFAPRSAFAHDEAPSVVSYGSQGFGTGALTGLAVGYLSTGPTWDKGEWRNLLYGAGIGALTGLGTGLLLGVADAGLTPDRPGPGYYMLRDSNYGVSLGALAGATVGALSWLGDGSSKDVLIGLSWGAVAGTGAGLVFGLFEGLLRMGAPADERGARRASNRLALGLVALPDRYGRLVPTPVLSGRF
jgi:hypothetical protein